MSRDDPFEKWDIYPKLKRSLSPQRRAQLDAEARVALDELQQFLDHPPPRRSFWDVQIGLLPQSYALTPNLVSRAQDLYRRIVATGGAGNTYLQEHLLDHLAATEDSASIPFWLDIVNLARPAIRSRPSAAPMPSPRSPGSQSVATCPRRTRHCGNSRDTRAQTSARSRCITSDARIAMADVHCPPRYLQGYRALPCAIGVRATLSGAYAPARDRQSGAAR